MKRLNQQQWEMKKEQIHALLTDLVVDSNITCALDCEADGAGESVDFSVYGTSYVDIREALRHIVSIDDIEALVKIAQANVDLKSL